MSMLMNAQSQDSSLRAFDNAGSPLPEVQLLSNGRYHVMVTNAGAGFSRYKELAVTRWQEDATCDNWGSFCYVRDISSGVFWSSTHQPTLKTAEFYKVGFSAGKAEFRRRDLDCETHTEIAVSSENDVEVRRIRLTNYSVARRLLELTSYSEVVLSPSATDSTHPAFSKLFVETEIIHERHAILCTRRPRAPGEPTPWMFHTLVMHWPGICEISYETDRMQFIGRGRTVVDPQAMYGNRTLSGAAGPVLDPIASIRCCLSIDSGATATVDLISGICETRDTCIGLLGACQVKGYADGVIAVAARTPGRNGAPKPAEQGYLHCGPTGAGHFVKMVHNGIEYGLMAAYAEGFNVLRNANAGKRARKADAETAPLRSPEYYQYDLALPEIAEVWRRGSVIGSWLLDLTAASLNESPDLESYAGRVSDSGEGRWTIDAAIDEGVPVPVLSAALFERFSSRDGADFANRVLSAMRHQFGGHVEKKAGHRNE